MLAIVLAAVAVYNVLFFAAYPIQGSAYLFVLTAIVALTWQVVTLRRFIRHPFMSEALEKLGNKGPLVGTYVLVLIFVMIKHTWVHYQGGDLTSHSPSTRWAVLGLATFFSVVFGFRRFMKHRNLDVFLYALISVWVSIPLALQTTDFPMIATLTIFPGLGWITPAYFPESSPVTLPIIGRVSFSGQFPAITPSR